MVLVLHQIVGEEVIEASGSAHITAIGRVSLLHYHIVHRVLVSYPVL